MEYGEENLSRIKSKKQKEVTFLMADAAYRVRKYRTAVKYFDTYVAKTPKPSRETYFQLGYSNYQLGEYQPALDAFGESATQDDSLSQLANYYIGDIFIKLDKKLAAKQAFFYAFSYYGLDKDIQENALFNYAKLSYQTAESPFESAIDALKEYLKQFPNSVRREEIYTYLLNIYMTTNYYQLALESIEQVENKDFRIKSAYQIVAYNYGVDLFQKGRFQKAIEMFQEVDKYPYEKDLNAKSVYWIAESLL